MELNRLTGLSKLLNMTFGNLRTRKLHIVDDPQKRLHNDDKIGPATYLCNLEQRTRAFQIQEWRKSSWDT